MLAMLLAAVVPAPALAQGGDEVIRDCAEDGDLDGEYTQEELDDAYRNMPSDIDEYSTCREVIESAREQRGGVGDNNAGSPGGGTTGGPSGAGPSPGGSRNDIDELEARAERSRADDAPTAGLAGEELSSSGGTYATDAGSDGMPTALMVALILVAVGALAGAAYLLRDHLPPAIASRLPGPLKPDSQV
jgi:hypothetical protein